MFRKSAYGRTKLYLPTTGLILREIRCMGGIERRECANVYHVLPSAHGTQSCCWHCCEDVVHPIPLPRVYDTSDKTYYVYGVTCSPSCAKAYVLEHTTFDRGQHLDLLVKMLADVYHVTGIVVETPPRAALRRFGGPFDPRVAPKAECRLVQPPFVSYCMIAEERGVNKERLTVGPAPMVEESDTFDAQPQEGMFEPFVQEMQTQQQAPPPAAPARSERKRPAKPVVGPMTRFVKSK